MGQEARAQAITGQEPGWRQSFQESVLKCEVLAEPGEEPGKEVQERTAWDSRAGCLLAWRAGVEGKGRHTARYETGLLSLEWPLLPGEKDHPSVHLQANSLYNIPPPVRVEAS